MNCKKNQFDKIVISSDENVIIMKYNFEYDAFILRSDRLYSGLKEFVFQVSDVRRIVTDDLDSSP